MCNGLGLDNYFSLIQFVIDNLIISETLANS